MFYIRLMCTLFSRFIECSKFSAIYVLPMFFYLVARTVWHSWLVVLSRFSRWRFRRIAVLLQCYLYLFSKDVVWFAQFGFIFTFLLIMFLILTCLSCFWGAEIVLCTVSASSQLYQQLLHGRGYLPVCQHPPDPWTDNLSSA